MTDLEAAELVLKDPGSGPYQPITVQLARAVIGLTHQNAILNRAMKLYGTGSDFLINVRKLCESEMEEIKNAAKKR